MPNLQMLWAHTHVYRKDEISPTATKFYYFVKDYKAFGSITIEHGEECKSGSKKMELFDLLNDKWHEWESSRLNRNVRYRKGGE